MNKLLFSLALFCAVALGSTVQAAGIHGSFPSDIVLQIGDSNSYSGLATDGSAGYNPAIDVTNPLCLEYRNSNMSRAFTQIAKDQLNYFTVGVPAGSIGPGLTFLRDYYLPNRLTAGRNVTIVAAAAGGTGFSDGYWLAPNGLGVTNAVARANQAIAAHSGNVITVILWTTAANDAIAGMATATYLSDFATTIAYLRANITGATNVPVLVEPLAPAWVATNPSTFGLVSAALEQIPANVSKTGYVDPTASGLSGNILGQTAIPYHLTAPSDRLIGNPGFGNAWTNLSP